MYQKEKKYWLKHLDFIIVDLILFELAYFLAVFVRNRGNTGVSEVNYRMSAIIVIIFILVAASGRGVSWHFKERILPGICSGDEAGSFKYDKYQYLSLHH